MAHGTISVNVPASGAIWYKGSSNSITWTVAGSQIAWNYFSLYLYTDSGGIEDTIASNIDGTYRSYTYTPDIELDTASDYYILITGNYDHSGGV